MVQINTSGDFQNGFIVTLSDGDGEGDWAHLGRVLAQLHAQGLIINGGNLAFTGYRVRITRALESQLDNSLSLVDGFHRWLLNQL